MPTALRLVVMWMVGALALAVAWCVKMQPPAVVSPDAAPALPAAPAADEPRAAIAKYLRARYADDGGSWYAKAPLVEIENMALRRFLPHTRFFATKLEPGVLGGFIYWRDDVLVWFSRYWRDDVLVSFSRVNGEDDDIRSWPVDRSDDRSVQRFLQQFLGVPASTAADRRELALALAQLLAAATERGSARSSTRCFKDTHAELWRGREPWLGREHWRDIVVLTTNDRVSRIQMWNQIDHRLEAKVSSY